MSGPLRSALLVLAAALAAGALIGVVYSWRDAALTVLLLLVLGAPPDKGCGQWFTTW